MDKMDILHDANYVCDKGFEKSVACQRDIFKCKGKCVDSHPDEFVNGTLGIDNIQMGIQQSKGERKLGGVLKSKDSLSSFNFRDRVCFMESRKISALGTIEETVSSANLETEVSFKAESLNPEEIHSLAGVENMKNLELSTHLPRSIYLLHLPSSCFLLLEYIFSSLNSWERGEKDEDICFG